MAEFFLLRRLQVCYSSKKALHHHCFPNDLAKLCRTALTQCTSTFTSTKNWLCDLQNKLIPGKQVHEVPINYYTFIALLLLTVSMRLSTGYNPSVIWLNIIRYLFLLTIDNSRRSLLFSSLATLKPYRKTCIVKCNFSNTSSRPKACYPDTKEMFAIQALSFLSNSVTPFTSCNS